MSQAAPSPNLPNLANGVPGVSWNDPGSPEVGKPRPRPLRLDHDAGDSHVLYLSMIFGIALALRLLLMMMGPIGHIDLAYTAESTQTLTLAENLIQEKVFGLTEHPKGSLAGQLDRMRIDRGEASGGLHREVYETPGYAAALAAFGLTGLGLTLWLVLQCLIGAMCVPAAYLLGRGLLGCKTPATVAAAVVAVHPLMVLAPATLSGEALAMLLVLTGLAAVAGGASGAGGRGLWAAVGGGLSLGVAALVSPVLVWLTPIAAAWMVLTERRIQAVALAGVLLLAAVIPVGGWMLRNSNHHGQPWLSAQTAVDRYFGSAVAMSGPEAAPYEPAAVAEQMATLRTQLEAAAPGEATVLSTLDRLGRDAVAGDRLGYFAAARRLAPRFALDHQLDEAYARLGIAYIPAGAAASRLGEAVGSASPEEPVTAQVVNAWVLGNLLLVVLGVIGGGLMLWRRQVAPLLLLLGIAGYVVWFIPAGQWDALRLPLLAIQAVAVGVIFGSSPLTEELATGGKMRGPRKLEDDEPQPNFSPLGNRGLEPAAKDAESEDDAPLPVEQAVHPALRAPAEPEDDGPEHKPLMQAPVGRPI